MSRTDIEINRQVRQILVRHWIDLGRLSIKTVDARVVMRGSLQTIGGVTPPFTGESVAVVLSEIRSVPGVIDVSPELDNWAPQDGAWKHIARF